MADNNDNKGDKGDKKPVIMDDDLKLETEIIRHHHSNGPNAEQWASIARGHGTTVAAVQKQWAEIEKKFLDVTKDEVPIKKDPKRRRGRGGKRANPGPQRPTQEAAPGLDDDDNDDDGGDTSALRFPPSERDAACSSPVVSGFDFAASESDEELSEGEELLMEGLARAAPFSAVGSQWWLRIARQREAGELTEEAAQRLLGVLPEEDDQQEGQGQPGEEKMPE
ncbi:hypothetical protein PG984_011662 [Apiospora sp. TS-2023a]